MQETEALRHFLERLKNLDIPFLIGGSVASSVHGHPRQTNDLDLAIQIDASNAARFLEEFEAEFTLTSSMIEQALNTHDEYRSFQMTHFESLLRIDCFIPTGTPFQEAEYARRVDLEILPGVYVPVVSAEDIVLRKLLWFELGGRVSDRQWNDIVAVLDVQAGLLDNSYLDEWADRLNVRQILDDARAQAIH